MELNICKLYLKINFMEVKNCNLFVQKIAYLMAYQLLHYCIIVLLIYTRIWFNYDSLRNDMFWFFPKYFKFLLILYRLCISIALTNKLFLFITVFSDYAVAGTTNGT